MLELNKIHNMNCIDGMRLLENNSIDSIVTDPPYELGFMGKSWDTTGIAYSIEMWKECFRILKPGGFLLSFGGTRTYHRMVCAIEDAGFEVRDQIQWIYGSGFPKSMDISKAIDKKFGAKREVIGHKVDISTGKPMSPKQARAGSGMNINEGWDRPWRQDEEHCKDMTLVTAPATDEAKQYSGWGTALKPAHEPIVVARKPLSEKTVADNVLKWGTGGINIDDCRVEYEQGGNLASNPSLRTHINGGNGGNIIAHEENRRIVIPNIQGRFPANIILDEKAGNILDEQTGILKSGDNCTRTKVGSFLEHGGLGKAGDVQKTYGDSGGASRFFYCAKASKKERGEGNNHPTVKPLSLIKYLVTLVTPPKGISCDPFEGSGTHAKACKELGFNYIGFENESSYCEIAENRL